MLGTEHPDTLITANNLADTYRQQGRLAEAEALLVEVLAASRRVRGAGGRVGARTVREEHVPAGAEAELQRGHALGGCQLEHRHACLLVSNDETSF